MFQTGTCQCYHVLPEPWQCRRTPTWLYQGCCVHAHFSSQRKRSRCHLQPTARQENKCSSSRLCFAVCVCAQSVYVLYSFFYLDKVFGPSCPQDTATAISQSVSSIFCYFTTVCVGTSVDNQLKYYRIRLEWHKMHVTATKGWMPFSLQRAVRVNTLS